MAKKSKKHEQGKTYRKMQEERQRLWILRLTVGVLYLLVWLISMNWVTENLPDPVSAEKFYADSKAHWFMNAGFGIMFVIIQYYLGREPEKETEQGRK